MASVLSAWLCSNIGLMQRLAQLALAADILPSACLGGLAMACSEQALFVVTVIIIADYCIFEQLSTVVGVDGSDEVVKFSGAMRKSLV